MRRVAVEPLIAPYVVLSHEAWECRIKYNTSSTVLSATSRVGVFLKGCFREVVL